jgi:hypothetical protein
MGLRANLRFLLNKYLHVCCISWALLVPDLSLAASDKNQTWYQIEVIVAKRIDQNISLEAFPSEPAAIASGSRVLAEFNADIGNPFQLDNEEFISLPLDLRILNNEVKALTNNDQYDVLLHQSWRQILIGNKAINWINIGSGYSWGGHQQLEGRLGFSKGRFLHIFSDLHLNQFQSFATDMSQRASRQSLQLDRSLAPQIKTRYSLVQRRKMRSKELHYLDHPKLVLLVKVIPYTPAETMINTDAIITTIPAMEITLADPTKLNGVEEKPEAPAAPIVDPTL